MFEFYKKKFYLNIKKKDKHVISEIFLIVKYCKYIN